MGDIKRITKILIFIFFISLFASCSNDIQYNQNQDAWNGNWYGYIGDTFYKLYFNGDTACLYYSSSYEYRPLYEATIYESTLTTFSIYFTYDSYGKRLNEKMHIYGTKIHKRDDGFYLWNSTDRPFFRFD